MIIDSQPIWKLVFRSGMSTKVDMLMLWQYFKWFNGLAELSVIENGGHRQVPVNEKASLSLFRRISNKKISQAALFFSTSLIIDSR